jgi:transposase
MSSDAGRKEPIMENIFARCAGLDVHKESVESCVRRIEPTGRLHQETRHWATMTRDILVMADWMAAQGVTHVAMESTGVFWKPIYNILEGRFTMLLVNARHLKQVPGRKSDVRDCQWIAQLLQDGLLKGSFIPPRPQGELRDLTRHRMQLVEEKTRTVNRLHKVLEDANIKLASVASDLLGASGRAILEPLIEGEQDPVGLADLAQRKWRGKIPELEKALQGQVTEHHRFMLQRLWKQLAQQEELTAELDRRIEEHTRPFADQVECLDTVPVADRTISSRVLGEGRNLSRPCRHGPPAGAPQGRSPTYCRRRGGRRVSVRAVALQNAGQVAVNAFPPAARRKTTARGQT